MPLPDFNGLGDLPEGIYEATLDEVLARFGRGSAQREEVTRRLNNIVQLAKSTGCLDRLVVFGSYVTNKAAPNDIDVVLVMRDDFEIEKWKASPLFNHDRAAAELGASLFWIRLGMLLGEPLDVFIGHWQVKREGGRRGIVVVRR